MEVKRLVEALHKTDSIVRYGKVYRNVGLLIESKGPAVNIGEVCYIHSATSEKEPILAEVVGFQHEHVLLMPYEQTNQIGPGSLVESLNRSLTVKAGEGLIGQVLDGLGNPLDGSKLPSDFIPYEAEKQPLNPLARPPIDQVLSTGIKAIDTCMTVGRGQRLGIFAGSGVGKSTLLGMLARNSDADVNVFALLGERGREVREFIEQELGTAGLAKSIVVVATSDQPALQRIRGAYTATAISEYFRDQGYQVNLMMDSLTRIAMAQREVGLASGEPPTTKGYPPSVFAMLPKLLERTGTGEVGSITAFYTVLVDGDDMDEPIADAVWGLLDGHLVLDRRLAEQGQYPAINVLKSVSRLIQKIADQEHSELAKKLRSLLATYEENKELIQIGAYKKGSSAKVDEAIYYYPEIMSFLAQNTKEDSNLTQSLSELSRILKG